MKTKLAAVFLLSIVLVDPVRAGVIVLANRTANKITFTAAGGAPQKIGSFEQTVLYADGSITVSFESGKETRSYRVEPDAAYFFADIFGGGIALSGIGAANGREQPADSAPAKPAGVLLKPPPLVTIPVRIFVDEEEPARQVVWEARLRRRIAAASALLEQTCRVHIEVVAADIWQSDNKAGDLPALLTDFERKVPRGNSPLSIGFTSQRTPDETVVVHLGGTRVPLHPYILLREWTPPNEPGRLEVVLHELGHYLGAVHSPEMTSVMRAKLGDGRSVSRRFPVSYDPLNTLAMNLLVDELRTRKVRSLADLSLPTKERLRQIYGEVRTAIPDDPTPGKFIALLGPPPPPAAPKPEPAADAPPANELVDNARVIIATVIKAAERNRKLPDRATPGTAPPFRRSGDALTEYYFREAAIVARDLPQGQAAPAYLVGMAISLDTADLFRKNPVTGELWRRIEPDADRERRLKVLGLPTMYARHDSCQHFVDSAALVAIGGPIAADTAGVVKELLDSRPGGSGFSFADLASDMSGVAFGRELLAEPGLLLRLADNFRVADFALPPDGLVEGLTYQEFTARFGSIADRRFTDEQEKLRKRIRELPAYTAAPPARPAENKLPEKAAPAKPIPETPKEPATPEKATPEPMPVEKAAPEQPTVPPSPAPAPPPAPALRPVTQTPASRPLAMQLPRSTLALVGLGLAALAGAFYAIRPRRSTPGNAPSVRSSALSGTVLALTGLALLGSAYMRWSAGGDKSDAAMTITESDLYPPWGDAPLDPFQIPTLRSIRIPNVADARAMWGATGRDSRGHIWFGVSASGEVEPSAQLFEYDPESAAITERGDALAALHSRNLLRPGECQGTIRTRIVEAPDGYLYFASTDEAGTGAAEVRGSHLWRLRPPDGRWEHLLSVPEKLIAAACGGPYVYALGYPDHVLYQFEYATGQVRSVRVGSIEGHFSSNILVDPRGHVYVPRLQQAPAGIVATLVELDRDLAEVAETPLDPPGRADRDDLQGLVAVQPLADGSLAFVTDRDFLYRLVPGEEERPAKVSALGAFHPRGDSNVVGLFSPDGQRYLMGLARRPQSRERPYDWLVFDLNTGHPVVVPVTLPTESDRPLTNLLLSGCMTRDDQGRFYLGGTYTRGGVTNPVLVQVGSAH